LFCFLSVKKKKPKSSQKERARTTPNNENLKSVKKFTAPKQVLEQSLTQAYQVVIIEPETF